MPQFKNIVRPVVPLGHVGRFLIKRLLMMWMHICWIFTLQGLGIFLWGSFGRNTLLIWTTLSYNSNSTPYKGDFNFHLNFILLICMHIAYFLNLYITRSWYIFCAGNLAEISYWYEILCHIIPTPPNEQASIFLEYCNSYQCWNYLSWNPALWFDQTIQVSS